MATRKIIRIDEDKCNGCGLCVPSCAEGALQIIDGKARIVKEQYCDGLGACLGECPQGALKIIEKDALDFDELAVQKHLEKNRIGPKLADRSLDHLHGGCPGSKMMVLKPKENLEIKGSSGTAQSELGQWPVQLHLVPVNAPYFQGADLLVAADCVPFAYADFHRKFLKGKAVVIGCPKLDDNQVYLEKLTSIIQENDLRSVTIVHMEVPCCFGMVNLVKDAVHQAGNKVPIYEATIGINGEIKN